MKIAVAADHGGYELKAQIVEHLQKKGHELLDMGTNSCESVDYPVFGQACAQAVADGKAELGMVFCGSGIGISIAANKVKGIRCALCTSTEMAALSKQHNNANVLALGGRILTYEQARDIVDVWLSTEFEGGRHKRRTDLLDCM